MKSFLVFGAETLLQQQARTTLGVQAPTSHTADSPEEMKCSWIRQG